MTNSEMHQGVYLAGQDAIVTGGGRGVGRAIALALAEAGAAVAVVARTEGEHSETVGLTAEAGGRAAAFPADVTDKAAIEQVVAEVEQQRGSVEMLFNNSGVLGPGGPSWEIASDLRSGGRTQRVWDSTTRGNLACR